MKISNEQKRMAKKGIVKNPSSVVVGVTEKFPAHQEAILNFLSGKLDRATSSFPSDVMEQVKTFVRSHDDLEKEIKKVLQKAAFIVSHVAEEGPIILETSVPFDQTKILDEQSDFCEKAVGLPFSVQPADEKDATATPGSPSITIVYGEQ